MPQYDTLRDRKVRAFNQLEKWGKERKVILKRSTPMPEYLDEIWLDIIIEEDLIATSDESLLVAVEDAMSRRGKT